LLVFIFSIVPLQQYRR